MTKKLGYSSHYEGCWLTSCNLQLTFQYGYFINKLLFNVHFCLNRQPAKFTLTLYLVTGPETQKSS